MGSDFEGAAELKLKSSLDFLLGDDSWFGPGTMDLIPQDFYFEEMWCD